MCEWDKKEGKYDCVYNSSAGNLYQRRTVCKEAADGRAAYQPGLRSLLCRSLEGECRQGVAGKEKDAGRENRKKAPVGGAAGSRVNILQKAAQIFFPGITYG